MWVCPKCGRSFQRQNQGHYCGMAPESVDAYVKEQDEAHQKRLEELVGLVRSVAPDSEGTIKWSMPSFQSRTGSLQFSACKQWISLYVGADVIERFRDDLEGLRHKIDALYLPYEQPVPWETIRQMIKEALREES